MHEFRTHTCGELRKQDVGTTARLSGWIHSVRDHGGIIFIDLRDHYGKTQVVIDPTKDFYQELERWRVETVVCFTGKVVARTPETVNPKISTGEIELVADEMTVLGETEQLPFLVAKDEDAPEALRLKYRFLDLRREDLHNHIVMRAKLIEALRRKMWDLGFTEYQTPILTSSSPEGARDYLVPSRVHPGKFYALPQAPQQFKQLLMTSGFDRYFQIAPCFRDEDARGDRTPGEFYQMDMEMAFADQEDVLAVLEKVLVPVFEKYGLYKRITPAPFKRIPYLEAMEKYGTDKPDLRIDLELVDATELLKGIGFGPFEESADTKIKAVVVSDFKATRKQIDQLVADVEVQTARKTFWFRVDENNEIVGGISKFVAPIKDKVIETLGLKAGDFVGLAAGPLGVAQKTAGVMRSKLGILCPEHMDKEQYQFCWIVDFPMYEIGEESGELEFCHNPFSMPNGGLEILEKASKGEVDPLSITAFQYDLVINGYESASGAVRNHDPEIMVKAFEMVRLGEDAVKAKFPAMYNAFTYGAPPHAGAAPGVDRMIMLLTGEESIREVITFPMNKNAADLMMDAPSAVSDKQLEELHLKCVVPKEDEE